MSLDIESKIAELLLQNTPADQIAERLIAEVMSQKNAAGWIPPVGYFLLNSGQIKKLFTFSKELLERSEVLPWGALCIALTDLSEEIPSDYIEALREGAKENSRIDDLLFNKQLCRMDSQLQGIKDNKNKSIQLRHQERRQALIDKLSYLKSQRLLKDEALTLEEFKKLFPGDPFIKSYSNEFDKRHAAQIIKDVAESQKPQKQLKRPIVHSKENIRWARMLLEHIETLVKKRPESAVDFTMFFYFLEFFEEANYILSFAPSAPATDWLSLELKILSRRYVDAIEEARSLEQKYSLDPEATFATTYARALCLWELGQESLAISILQGIIKIRPHFRSAGSLLQQWSQEVT